MIMIRYSSLMIVGSVELFIFAQSVTQISRLVDTSQKENNVIHCFCLLYKYYTNTVSIPYNSLDPKVTGTIRFEVNYSRVRRNVHQMTNGWWDEDIGVCSLVGYQRYTETCKKYSVTVAFMLCVLYKITIVQNFIQKSILVWFWWKCLPTEARTYVVFCDYFTIFVEGHILNIFDWNL